MPKPIDDTGKKFGRLVVIGRKRENGITFYFCTCDCGNNITTHAYSIRSGATQSCGCLSKERRTEIHTTHGECRTQTYKAWCNIKHRCFNPESRCYKRYGAVGITMFPLWKDNYIAFRDYIGHPPEDGKRYSVDRIDNNGNYEPGNVRWSTQKEQTRNRGMMVTNKTGVTGVIFNENNDCYIAKWNTLEGKRKSKTFGINKYGKEEAFRLACEYRELMIKELNAQGAGYSENHGK